ncbi:MAG: hypothetical protein LBU83_03375 [Bacteroidales bacterium]|jgi:hypothetical protein|nr:hypothetical protein [Bacteroidales bacterium]
MKKPIFLIISLFALIIIGLTGCEKDFYKDRIIGKWKLDKVIFCDTTIIDGHYQQFEIDCLENSIIYEFKKNNKLIITNSILGNLQITKYSYKCDKIPGTWCYTEPVVLQITIDKETYYYTQYPEDQLSISGESINHIFDETDSVIIKQENLQIWRKKFTKLK